MFREALAFMVIIFFLAVAFHGEPENFVLAKQAIHKYLLAATK